MRSEEEEETRDEKRRSEEEEKDSAPRPPPLAAVFVLLCLHLPLSLSRSLCDGSLQTPLLFLLALHATHTHTRAPNPSPLHASARRLPSSHQPLMIPNEYDPLLPPLSSHVVYSKTETKKVQTAGLSSLSVLIGLRQTDLFLNTRWETHGLPTKRQQIWVGGPRGCPGGCRVVGVWLGFCVERKRRRRCSHDAGATPSAAAATASVAAAAPLAAAAPSRAPAPPLPKA